MRYKLFGRRTGLRVSELDLGAGNFGTRWGHGAERSEAKKVFDAYAAAGGNFIDTATAVMRLLPARRFCHLSSRASSPRHRLRWRLR